MSRACSKRPRTTAYPSRAPSSSAPRSAAGSSSPTSAASCIVTSSPATSGSRPRAWRRSATSASPSPSTAAASAAEVRAVLAAVEQNEAAPPPAAVEAPRASAGDGDPLYRRTFVGREPELRQLQQAFDAALGGEGGLAMVVGEPGIGKTALCE